MQINEIMEGVREYVERSSVELVTIVDDETREERVVILATNEGGYNSTQVDLLDLLKWLNKNLPTLLLAYRDIVNIRDEL